MRDVAVYLLLGLALYLAAFLCGEARAWLHRLEARDDAEDPRTRG